MEEKSASKKKKAMIGILLVFLLMIIIFLGFIIYELTHQEEEARGLPSENLVTAETEGEMENATFTTDMNMVWSFPSGSRTSTDAIVGNSSQNGYDVYFEVYLVDEGNTLLYTSPILPVGKRLEKLKLDKTLPDGEHAAVCTFHLLDQEDHDREVSDISFEVDLIFGDQE